MKQRLKQLLNLLSQIIVLPLIILAKLEEIIFSRDTETLFHICSHMLALIPGLPGVFLRRGFYSVTLDKCSTDAYIGFGTIFSHRHNTIEKHVYIGSYAIIGSANIGEHSLIGSRVSILSGAALHELGEDGRWTPYSSDKLAQITIDKNVWIGEGVIISADVGEGSMVGAGSVISSNVRPHIIVTGNPARFVKKLDDPD